VRYSLIDATFRTGYVENSPANSTADANGDIVVSPGSRIPSIPRQSLRIRMDYEFNDAVSLGANLVANSGSRLRGDENNQDVNGQVPGYAVLNLDGRWKVTKNLELFARIDNALDEVNNTRATFGATQSRFDAVISNLQQAVENQSAARSRIMDADFAAETAAMSRAQILQQAGNAMVAQANQLPQQVLSLLRGG